MLLCKCELISCLHSISVCCRAQRHAACRRAEAISVASNIMDDVMNSAPFLALDSGCSVEKSSIEMIAKQLVTDVIYKATRLFKHDQGWELVKLPVATVSFNEVIAYPSDLVRIVYSLHRAETCCIQYVVLYCVKCCML